MKIITFLNIYDHKEGGSMICNEEKSQLDYIPSEGEIKKMVVQHKKQYDVETVLFTLHGTVDYFD